MDVIVQVVTFLGTFIQATNIIISAIQYIFDLIITVFTSFFSIWNWLSSSMRLIYQFSQIVPAWLWVIPLAWISYRLVVFVKTVGGD